MTNTFLIDSDEAIVDFVKDHEELYDKTNEPFKKRQGRIVSGKALPGNTNCPDLQDMHGLSPKGDSMTSLQSPNLARSQRS